MLQVFDIATAQVQHKLAIATRAEGLSARVARVAQHFSHKVQTPKLHISWVVLCL